MTTGTRSFTSGKIIFMNYSINVHLFNALLSSFTRFRISPHKLYILFSTLVENHAVLPLNMLFLRYFAQKEGRDVPVRFFYNSKRVKYSIIYHTMYYISVPLLFFTQVNVWNRYKRFMKQSFITIPFRLNSTHDPSLTVTDPLSVLKETYTHLI